MANQSKVITGTDLQATLSAAGYAKVIVVLKPPAALTAAAAVAAAVPPVKFNKAQVESVLQNFFIVPSEAQAAGLRMSAARASNRLLRAAPKAPRVRVFPHLGLALGFVDASGLDAIESHPAVATVVEAPELSLIKPVIKNPAKLTVAASWGIKRLRADQLWAAGYTGKGILVGHLDTGVDASHPSLKGAVAVFAEFDLVGNKVPGAKPRDSDEHGTHTAGTIVGRPGTKGAFGMAPEAKLVSGMVIEGGQVIDRILSGLEWIVEQKVRIMSMSLGLRGFTPAFQVVIDALRAANVLPVIAVGNEFSNTSRSPGNYANVLSVGAIDKNDIVADFSSSQKFNRSDDALVPDLVAPGVDVISCIPGGKFAAMDGTSMATPHVAGLAALLLQAVPTAGAAQLENAIQGSCIRPGSMPEARANRGVPDAVQAFQLLTGRSLPVAAKTLGRRRKFTAARRKAKRPQIKRRAAAASKGRPKREVARGKKDSKRRSRAV